MSLNSRAPRLLSTLSACSIFLATAALSTAHAESDTGASSSDGSAAAGGGSALTNSPNGTPNTKSAARTGANAPNANSTPAPLKASGGNEQGN